MDPEYLIVGELDHLEGDQLERYRAEMRQEAYRLRADMTSVGGMRESMKLASDKQQQAKPKKLKRSPSRSRSVLRRLSRNSLEDEGGETAETETVAPASIELGAVGAQASAGPASGSASNPIAALGLGSTYMATRRKSSRIHPAASEALGDFSDEGEEEQGSTEF
jgi:hypothetical protein